MQLSARSTRRPPRFPVLVLVVLASSASSLPASGADEQQQQGTEHPAKTEVPAKLEDTASKHVSLEMAGYQDTDHVVVYSPSVGIGIENVTGGVSLHGSYLLDVVSEASVDIVSTASRAVHEIRHAGSVETEYKPHDFGIALGGSVSAEPDYLSVGGGAQVTKDFDEKNTTLLFGYGYSKDTAGRGGTPYTVFARALERGTFNGGVTQVINKSTIASLAMDLVIEHGDQSKPYRYIPMFSPDVAANVPNGASIAYVTSHRLPERPLEQLPLERNRLALTGRIGHRFEGSTVRGEERLYYDNWGLLASTTDGRWIFDLGRRFALWPHLRLHLQKQVSFWQRAYSSDPNGWSLPEFRTGDRELGPLRTYTGGAGFRLNMGPEADPQSWSLTVQGDVMHTSFLDDLYLTGRTGFIGTMTLEADL